MPEILSGSAIFPFPNGFPGFHNLAASTTLFPDVFGDRIPRACRIGTPDLISVPSVRVNLETATFFNISPKTGRRIKAHRRRLFVPFSVLYHFLAAIDSPIGMKSKYMKLLPQGNREAARKNACGKG